MRRSSRITASDEQVPVRPRPGITPLAACLLAACLLAAGCGARRPAVGAPGGGGSDPAAVQGGQGTVAVVEAAQVGGAGSEPTPPFQGIFGVVRQERPDVPMGTQQAVRTAVHAGYDRVVFEFSGERLPGYRIEYIDQPIRACGSGEVVPLAGTGRLRVRFQPGRAHTDTGESTLDRRVLAPDHPVLRELELTCDFEGQLEWALGLATPKAYRVLELTGPARLVVDVGH